MASLSPYIHFPGNCTEAMNHYKEIFGGELQIMKIGGSPMEAQMPPEAKEQVMHSMLESDKITLMASDMGDPAKMSGNTDLCLVCTSKEEIQELFAKLSEGGTVDHELKDEFFGTYGDLTDKFGVRWMLQYSPQTK